MRGSKSFVLGHICLIFLWISNVVSQDTTGDTTGSYVSTIGTTGNFGTTGSYVSTTGTTGIVVKTTPLPSSGSVNVTVTLGSSQATIDISIPAVANCSNATYGDANPHDNTYEDPTMKQPKNGVYQGVTFEITIYENDGQVYSGPIPPMAVHLTVPGITENFKVFLFDFATMQWEDASLTCSPPSLVIDVEAGTLDVDVCHLTQFALYQTTPNVPSPAVSSVSSNTGLLATVIIVPIVIVGIVIGLVAWTLLRKDRQEENTVELGTRKPATVAPTPVVKATDQPDSEDEAETSEDEEEHTSEEESEDEKKKESESESEEEEKKEKKDNSGSESETSSSSESSSSSAASRKKT